MLTHTEENYIKTIYLLLGNEKEQVGTNNLAAELKTTAAAVTTMLKRIARKNLVNYTKYQGVSLTHSGKMEAVRLVRNHRLWETFLVTKLRFRWDEVHDMAEQLEHVNSRELINRLDQFLGRPKLDPHGDPIPSSEGTIYEVLSKPLIELEPGSIATVAGVKDSEPLFLKYLDRLGVVIGSKIQIVEKIEFDGSVEIIIENADPVFISKEVATNLLMS